MKTIYLVDGLTCAHCADQIETALNKLNGVTSATVNFIMQRITIEFNEDNQQEVLQNTERIVKKTEPFAQLKQILLKGTKK